MECGEWMGSGGGGKQPRLLIRSGRVQGQAPGARLATDGSLRSLRSWLGVVSGLFSPALQQQHNHHAKKSPLHHSQHQPSSLSHISVQILFLQQKQTPVTSSNCFYVNRELEEFRYGQPLVRRHIPLPFWIKSRALSLQE